MSLKEKPGNSRLRNGAGGECIDYHSGIQPLHRNAVNIAVATGPCRTTGEGRLFRIDPLPGTSGDGSCLLRAELRAGEPGHETQLGMLTWLGGECPCPPPERGAPVVLTCNCYGAVRLCCLVDVLAPASGAPLYTCVNSSE
ncbi:hypothetical protein OG741_00705 [Streptomyces sp. NBC_01410]|uniref:hypothetical protein n=1 Tax=Streptomyces sp. NBC_01410 TaxID=2903856 RepID=UPI00324A056C